MPLFTVTYTIDADNMAAAMASLFYPDGDPTREHLTNVTIKEA